MKRRVTEHGVHFYDRTSGLHILFDEIKPPECDWDIGPEVLSIALLGLCNLRCRHCYQNKSDVCLSFESVLEWCKESDRCGVLSVALGGGEPLLFPNIASLTKAIWEKTNLGVTITTNGFLLTESLVDQLQCTISALRLYLDGPEPVFSMIRGRTLDDLLLKVEFVRGKIPLAINAVVTSEVLPLLDELFALAVELQAMELLILPVIRDSQIALNTKELEQLDSWLCTSRCKVQPVVSVSEMAVPYLSGPFLFPRNADRLAYLHVSPTGFMSRNSFGEKAGGVSLYSSPSIKDAFSNFSKSGDVLR